MFTSGVIVFIASLCFSKAEEDALNGQTFLIRNKHFDHASFGQIRSPSGEDVCHSCLATSEGVNKNQLWKFTSATNYGGQPGYYYIENAIYGSRLALMDHKKSKKCPPAPGPNTGDACLCYTAGAYDGKYHLDNHLWKVELKHLNADPTWDYYYIKNKQEQTIYYQPMLTKVAQDDASWGTLSCENARWPEDLALWRLVPRFKASAENAVIWQADNRKGSYPFTEKITVTRGVTLTSSKNLTTTDTVTKSLTAAVNLLKKIVNIGANYTINNEIVKSVSSESVQTWSRTSETTFTAPPSKNYRVLQLQVAFISQIPNDSLMYSAGKYIIEETDGDFNDKAYASFIKRTEVEIPWTD